MWFGGSPSVSSVSCFRSLNRDTICPWGGMCQRYLFTIDLRGERLVVQSDLVPDFLRSARPRLEKISPSRTLGAAMLVVFAVACSRSPNTTVASAPMAGKRVEGDLGMVAAHAVGDLTARCEAATQAGVDVVLPCNDRPGLIEILDRWQPEPEASLPRKWERMRKKIAGRRL